MIVRIWTYSMPVTKSTKFMIADNILTTVYLNCVYSIKLSYPQTLLAMGTIIIIVVLLMPAVMHGHTGYIVYDHYLTICL